MRADKELADQVAQKLMEKDALQAHAMDELGIRDFTQAAPFQAAIASFLMFLVFGCIPFFSAVFIPDRWVLIGAYFSRACLYVTHSVTIGVVVGVTLIALAMSGALGAHFGGAPLWKGALRVTLGGAAAMALTAGAGLLTEYTGLDDLSF